MKRIIIIIGFFLFPLSMTFCVSYDEALGMFNGGQYSEARTAFQNYFVSNKNGEKTQPARFYAIKCLYKLKKYDDFTSEMAKLQIDSPNHPGLDDLAYLQAFSEDEQGHFDVSRSLFQEFLKNFPASPYYKNAQYYALKALYRLGRYNEFNQGVERLRATDPSHKSLDDLDLLKAQILVNSGQFTEARSLVDTLKTKYPSTDLKADFLDLRLSSWFKEKNFSVLAQEAQMAKNQAAPRSREWAYAAVWLGIAKMNTAPPDEAGAAELFGAILDENLGQTFIAPDTISAAALWRIAIAQKHNDTETARRYALKVKDQMPNGVQKQKLLMRLGKLTEE